MNNVELVWRLVVMLLHNEEKLNQIAIEQAKNSKSNEQKQDEA